MPYYDPAPKSVTSKAPEASADTQGEVQGPSSHRHPVGRALCFMGIQCPIFVILGKLMLQGKSWSAFLPYVMKTLVNSFDTICGN